jgi:RNA polymerase sigma-70 factor (ECF subfamily)
MPYLGQQTRLVLSLFNLYSDDRLVRQLTAGSEHAFKVIFDRYWEKVYAICYRNTGAREESREMTQDIFKSLWERHATLEIKGSLGEYLGKAAKYQVYNFYRHKETEKRHMNCFFLEYCGEENCTENQVLYEQLQDRLGYLVDRLPCQCKAVFQLSRDKHMTHKQISELLGISVKTVEYHIANALKYLAKELR